MTTRIHTLRTGSRSNVANARAPWLIYADGTMLTVRGAAPQDLPGVAMMHKRCSAKTLLDRYRAGGRAPAVLILDSYLRQPLSFVARTEDGQVVALAQLSPDLDHTVGSVEIAILIEDEWQTLGIGRTLLRHAAAAAALAGYRQLIAYPGTTLPVIQRLMGTVGTTRLMADPQRHLHTTLPQSARDGLGSVHSHAVWDRRVG